MVERIDAASLSGRESYALMIDSIVPRPIAWVATLSPEGVHNLAPFSYFTGVCNRPPTLLFSVASGRGGQPKDTLYNLRALPELVVHIADEAMSEQLNASSVDAPATVSESGLLGLEVEPSSLVSVPRLKRAPLAMECRVSKLIEHGEGQAVTLVLAEILCWQIRDDLLGPDRRIFAHKLKPTARLGGRDYAGLGTIFSLPRPVWDPARPAPVRLGSKKS